MYELLIVVPYRDRLEHLCRFVPHMDDFLAGKSWKLLVVEQVPGAKFNRGKLINVGWSMGHDSARFICMHDVDMLPQDASCDYTPDSCYPVHLAGRTSQYKGKLPYPSYVGGVLMMSMAHFMLANGFDNDYWGWGREDDDLALRMGYVGLTWVNRPGLYLSLPHNKCTKVDIPKASQQKYHGLRANRRLMDGNGLVNLTYEVVLPARPVRELIGMPNIPTRHEIVTVDVGRQP